MTEFQGWIIMDSLGQNLQDRHTDRGTGRQMAWYKRQKHEQYTQALHNHLHTVITLSKDTIHNKSTCCQSATILTLVEQFCEGQVFMVCSVITIQGYIPGAWMTFSGYLVHGWPSLVWSRSPRELSHTHSTEHTGHQIAQIVARHTMPENGQWEN